MSDPKSRIAVSILARRDGRNALRRSGRQWGQEQRRRYRQVIDRAFETLLANPALGRRRDDYFPGCRTLPVGQHLICYRVDATEILIVRVIHARQDVTNVVFDLPAPESEQ